MATEIGKRNVYQARQTFRWNAEQNLTQENLFSQANLHFTQATDPVGAVYSRSSGIFSDR
jgi:hypothetical protein